MVLKNYWDEAMENRFWGNASKLKYEACASDFTAFLGIFFYLEFKFLGFSKLLFNGQVSMLSKILKVRQNLLISPLLASCDRHTLRKKNSWFMQAPSSRFSAPLLSLSLSPPIFQRTNWNNILWKLSQLTRVQLREVLARLKLSFLWLLRVYELGTGSLLLLWSLHLS